MPYSSLQFPSCNPIYGFNMYSELTDVIQRSYQEDQDALGAVITPSDTAPLGNTVSRLLLGTAGNVSVILDSGVTLQLNSLTAGVVHSFPFRILQINATGTTATGIVGIG